MILQPMPATEPPAPSSDLAWRIAILKALLEQPRLNDGRRAWARAELKRLRGK